MTTNLLRLAALRRNREQRALDVVIRENTLCRKAEQLADAAAIALARQVAQAHGRERQLVGSLAGRPVSPATIINVQMEIARAALETARLRTAAARAQASLLEQRDARAKAHDDYRRRQRAADKIDTLLKQVRASHARRDAALTEAEQEDHSAGGRHDGWGTPC
ncbi:MAG: YscO family type III secretion system apparatus protein [Acetobacteraceae bacterium]|nr:YscO family type III secretion system apparatus protein [Acetobacteraceae bacterium]